MRTPYDAAVRWRKNGLDALRRRLADAERMQAAVEERIAALEAEHRAEAEVALGQTSGDYGAYLRRMELRARQLLAELAATRTQVAQLADQVSEEFGALKTLDIAAERFRAAARTEQARREQNEIDEAALAQYLRQAEGESGR